MRIHHNRYTESKEVLVSCEQTFFVITEKGQIRYQRRLDYTPSCLLSYHLDAFGADIFEDEERTKDGVLTALQNRIPLETPCFMTIFGSFNNFLLVYKDVRLAWAARTQLAPIYVARALFENRDGLIVTMSDTGFLQVSYLGTEQQSISAQALSLKNQSAVDYSHVTQEHTRILHLIKSQESERQVEPTDKVTLSCQLAGRLEACNDYIDEGAVKLARSGFG